MDTSNKKGKVVKMNSDDSLLPKKRTSQKKDLAFHNFFQGTSHKSVTMNIQNIEAVSKRLIGLGFEDSILPQLVKNISFKVQDFMIHQRMIKDNDVVNFHLAFTANKSLNSYSCIYYDATLRKQIELPDIRIGEIEINELDKRMAEINWTNAFQNAENKIRDKGLDANSVEEKVENIVTDLCALEPMEEGKEIAVRLKVKYWCDTEVEKIVGNLNSLKSKFEISQRFYLFDDEKGISVEEAYRFLHNRWMEKQLQLRKKQDASNDRLQPHNDDSDKHLTEKPRNKRQKSKSTITKSF